MIDAIEIHQDKPSAPNVHIIAGEAPASPPGIEFKLMTSKFISTDPLAEIIQEKGKVCCKTVLMHGKMDIGTHDIKKM